MQESILQLVQVHVVIAQLDVFDLNTKQTTIQSYVLLDTLKMQQEVQDHEISLLKDITQLEQEQKFHVETENGLHLEEKILVYVQTDLLDTIVRAE